MLVRPSPRQTTCHVCKKLLMWQVGFCGRINLNLAHLILIQVLRLSQRACCKTPPNSTARVARTSTGRDHGWNPNTEKRKNLIYPVESWNGEFWQPPTVRQYFKILHGLLAHDDLHPPKLFEWKLYRIKRFANLPVHYISCSLHHANTGKKQQVLLEDVWSISSI